MSPKYRFIPIGGGGVTPTGTLEIRSEGTFDVTDYAEVDVDIFDDTTTKNITNNGTYNAEDDHVLGYSQVTVAVPASAVDSGTKQDTISTNGTSTINVVGYANHEVTVSVPASAVDSGTKQITTNGNNQDVVGYAAVDVNVQPNLTTETITLNGTYSSAAYDGYSSVTVAVPASAVDSGTKQITTNGNNQDVVGYAAVDVNVQPNLTTETIIDNGTYSPVAYDGYSSVTVNVPASAVDSGTKQITSNGNNQDVVGYAAVDVAVPAPYWEGTQAQYDALAPDYDNDTLYLITN